MRERIFAGLIAFAAADAFGAPWEGRESDELADAALLPLPRREGWPPGATSDDTAQLLIVAEVVAGGSDRAGRRFLTALTEAAPFIRGMGPTTEQAIARFRADGSLRASRGATNGAVMRAPAIGWGARDAAERALLVDEITPTTHGAPSALAAAHDVAALADSFLAGDGLAPGVGAGGWTPPPAGISLDATETVAAVLYVLERATSVSDAAERSVRLGGDTDTVAAVACGILAAHPEHAADPIPWLDQVRMPDIERLRRLAASLAARRAPDRPSRF